MQRDGVLDVREHIARVCDVEDAALHVLDGLDTKTVLVVDDLVVAYDESRDRVGSVQGGATDRADGDAVAARARVVLEDGVGARLHSQAVVLVDNSAALDGHVVVAAQIKAVRVLRHALAGG